jgi:hypothetical protein
MKNYLLMSVLIVASPLALFSQGGEIAAASEVAKLKSNYETSLNELLLKYIKRGDVASVSSVGSELKKLRPEFPEVEPDSAPAGYWDWKYNNMVTLASNGLAVCNGKNFGIWKWIDEKGGKAEVRWDNGYIDTFTISPDQRKLHIVNNLDVKFVADKIEKRAKN